MLASWDDPRDDDAHIDWARQAWRSLRPFSTGGVYVNGVADGDSVEIDGAYGTNLTRLAKLKAIYDPTNVFRHNANIAPRSSDDAE